MSTVDYAAQARATYADLLADGGLATLTRAGATTFTSATDTVTSTTASVTTAGALLPPDAQRDGTYRPASLSRQQRHRFLLASVDGSGVTLALAPQVGDSVTLGTVTATLSAVGIVAPNGVDVVLYDCEGDA